MLVAPLKSSKTYVSTTPIDCRDAYTIRKISSFRFFMGFKVWEDQMYPLFRLDHSIMRIATLSLQELGINLKQA